MFSNAEVIMARNANLEAYLRDRGHELGKEGRQYRVKDMSGLFVMRNLWYWHSRQQGGNALDYLMRVEGIAFRDAVAALTPYHEQAGNRGDAQDNAGSKSDDRKTTQFSPPTRNSVNSRAIAYLLKTRRIKPDVLYPLIQDGLVYEAANTHNAIFLGYDNGGAIRYAFERSTASWSQFRCESPGSDKQYAFSLCAGKGTGAIFVFESAIDLLSFLSLQSTPKSQNAAYVSLGGLTDIALWRHASARPGCEIIFCLDNDKPGTQASERLAAKWRTAGHHTSQLLPCDAKDWNDRLLSEYSPGQSNNSARPDPGKQPLEPPENDVGGEQHIDMDHK